VPLDPAGNAEGFIWCEGFVERSGAVEADVVDDQDNLDGVWEVCVHP
jgi:hypothetical protein